jgi:hypothetical protein
MEVVDCTGLLSRCRGERLFWEQLEQCVALAVLAYATLAVLAYAAFALLAYAAPLVLELLLEHIIYMYA